MAHFNTEERLNRNDKSRLWKYTERGEKKQRGIEEEREREREKNEKGREIEREVGTKMGWETECKTRKYYGEYLKYRR